MLTSIHINYAKMNSTASIGDSGYQAINDILLKAREIEKEKTDQMK